MIRSPLWFTGHYVANMILNPRNTGMNTKQKWWCKTRTQRSYKISLLEPIIESRCPDIVLIDKKNQETFIIDVAIPEDLCVRNKKAEKISKY